MVSVTAFISGVMREGSSSTEPTSSWAATRTANTNGSAASNRLMGYSLADRRFDAEVGEVVVGDCDRRSGKSPLDVGVDDRCQDLTLIRLSDDLTALSSCRNPCRMKHANDSSPRGA